MPYIIEKPLLAVNADDISKLSFPCLVTQKLDGIRAMCLNGELLSRSFKPIKNERMRQLLTELLPNGSDGELMTEGTFQATTSAVMTSKNSENFDKPFQFYWFDYVKNDPNKPYSERMQDMKEYIEAHPQMMKHKQIKIMPLFPKQIENAEELLEYEKDMLEQGFEGVMIRKPSGRYKMGRSTLKEGILLKLKQFSDAEGTVIGMTELLHNTNEKTTSATGHSVRSSKKEGKTQSGKMGALVVKTQQGIEFSLGSGFTDEQRVDYWNKSEDLIGKHVKYKFFVMGSKTCPRFPVFVGFRDSDDL